MKFTLAMQPVEIGSSIGEIVRELFWQARKHVSISTVYAASEFCTADTIYAFTEAGVSCVIPSPKNQRIKRAIARMQQDVEVTQGYAIYGSVLGSGTSERAETNLVLVPSTVDESKTVPLITNKDVDDEIGLDRRETVCVIGRYRRRWGIENSYKTIKKFLAWTTSKNFSVRIFYFGFAVLLYNMWLLVDLLVQLSLDIEHRYQPRVTAKRFLNLVRKQLAGIG